MLEIQTRRFLVYVNVTTCVVIVRVEATFTGPCLFYGRSQPVSSILRVSDDITSSRRSSSYFIATPLGRPSSLHY